MGNIFVIMGFCAIGFFIIFCVLNSIFDLELEHALCKKHEWVCVTNIYGDLINVYNCRSIYKCSKCGKYKKSWELDSKCKVVNFGFGKEIEN